jgi:hypothetical protein
MMHDEHPSAPADLAVDADANCDAGTPRRDFLQQLLSGGAAVAGVSLLGGCAQAAASTAAAPRAAAAARSEWDMSWTGRLGRYRTAYDSPEITGGAALAFAASAMQGYAQALGTRAGEVTPVVILRHTASYMVLDDDMWKRLAIGESQKLKDPTTGETALRNPFIRYAKGDRFTMIGADAGIDTLVGQGAIVLTCNRALTGIAGILRRKETGLTQEQAMAEIRKAVLPGVYPMPNGIFAVSAAQDAGCHYMRVA